ncbi:hypothetical protein [Porphyromonas asaccharolytica]
MNKSNFTSLCRVWSTLCLLLCCGFVSVLPLSAQEQPVWKFVLGAPAIESPMDVTKTGFTATWSNVEAQQLNEDGTPWNTVFFRLITTREILAKSDGYYNIANATVKPNPSGKRESIPETPTYLDKQLSQPGWISGLCYWTPNGFSINAKDLEGSGYPEDAIGVSARLTSPVMDLSNGDRKYTVEFTAKALQANSDVKMKVFGYGEEIVYLNGVPGVREFKIPNDGKEHKFNFDFEGGTWCHRIVIELNNFAEIEFSKNIVIKQNLKKGDRAYRSTSYFVLPSEQVKADCENPAGLSGPEEYRVKYSYVFKGLDSSILDIDAAKAEGERVAYRMLYADSRPGYQGKKNLSKSTYSEPAYFDNFVDPNEYLYVGYCNYEAPNYNALVPGGVTWAGYHGGAIKMTKEKLKDLVGSQVVGLRFVSAASMQKDQVNNDPGFYTPKLPCIFLAESVPTWDRSDINNLKLITPWKAIQVTTVEKFKNGWNTLFFDEPYEIKAESEFFAGAYAYDAAQAGGILVRSYQSPGVDPNSAWTASNWSTYTIEEAQFDSKVDKGEGPLLMQLIVKPKDAGPTIQNRGEISDLQSPPFIYTDEELKPTVQLFNSGIKAITKIKVETDVAGKKQTQTIALDKPLASSISKVVELQAIDHEGISGKSQLTVTLLEINGVALKTPSILTADLEILKRDEAFERTTLVEVFTSEQCKFCPAGVSWMDELINQPGNAKIKERLAIVSHHAFIAPDFMMLPYSQGLAPFYGVKNSAGNITLASTSSPTNMFNRKPLPALGDAKGQNGSVYSIISNQNELNEVAKAAEANPAAVFVEVKPWFQKESNTLNVLVQGRASARLDRSRPVYLTIMMTQDRIKPRQQAGNAPTGFMHTNVLRYVDEAGFKGSEVQFDDKGAFKVVKDIPVKATDATTGRLPANLFLLEGDNKSIEDVMKEVNVIAFLHYYEQLPTNDDVEENDPRLLKNEVLNAAQRRVSFTNFEGIEEVTPQDVQVTIEEGAVRVNVPVAGLQVYDMTGRLVPATGLKAGAYVVRLELQDGSKMFTKVVAK